ncbi:MULTISPECIES: hypothetical protein [Myxococcaceae]|uniref:hypothetical protein n=1 Tax=Myxococcaceae TaxID=31 RepID=UPI00129CB8D7|nr:MULTISPECIES: hypothetical protein [Myxococcaceae]MBF5041277.1 hypothetical protein [Simulacricoccus sp. 17bor-14]
MRALLPRLGRTAALLLLALWAVEPVATWVHYGDHTHLYCATHQTFEEGQRFGPAQAAWTPAAEAVAQLTQAPPAALDTAPRLHEACSVPGCGARHLAVLGARVERVLGPSLLSSSGVAPRTVPAPPLSALDTAPKASPPARA